MSSSFASLLPSLTGYHYLLLITVCVLTLERTSAGSLKGSEAAARRASAKGAGNPLLLPLNRETVPVLQDGKVVSLKTAYYGAVSLGGPKLQEFSVVFDTGSGHVILPSLECSSDTCKAHRRYNISNSPKAVPLNADSEPVPEGELGDQVTIGFGTGSVTGEFVRESVCLGPAEATSIAIKDRKQQKLCSSMSIVVAVEMSAQPFESFKFDGIFGLGLDSLALSNQFSFFSRLSAQSAKDFQKLPHFGIFLSDGAHGEQSEIAVGGHNADRLMGPLSWAPVALPKLGFWSVKISAVRINGVEVAECRKGECKGIVDTGTSHLGVPHHKVDSFTSLLAKTTIGDCRAVDAPRISFDINGFMLTLGPEDYMPAPPRDVNAEPAHVDQASANSSAPTRSNGVVVPHRCQPRVMPVNMKRPLGPNLFILGEPVLHRYYTVYDWQSKRIGFGLAKKRALSHQQALAPPGDGNAEVERLVPLDVPEEEEAGERIYLMQVSLTVSFFN
jgi:hypothetical protein